MTLFAQQVLNGLVIGSTYAVVALGFALVFTVMRVVNLAHPEFFMIATLVGLLAWSTFSGNLLMLLLAVVLVMIVLALLLQRAVLQPLRRQSVLMPLIATAGVSIFAEHTAAGIVGTDPIGFPSLTPAGGYTFVGLSISTAQLTNLAVSFLMMAAVSLYVRRTRWGRATRAMAEGPDLAASVGVDVVRVSQATIALSTVMAGLAGISVASLYQSTGPFVAQFYALKSFTTMLVAGNRHVEGVMGVGLLLGVIEALVTGYVSSALRDAVAFGVLIVVLAFRPNGLFGSYST